MNRHDRTRAKILTRQGLLTLREQARVEGRAVVQCHGCFDIVHPGHIRHLQHAARQGDILLVTITADAVMAKGTGRPLIPQELRAENLAALDIVDWVYINPDATAEPLLEEARPDVYIKGREYEHNHDPRFLAEKRAVERHGGRVVFSSGDVVFSSTALISSLEERADPFHARLKQLTETHGLTAARVEPLIDAFRGVPVCVVGETIIDTYVLCDRPDVAGESPVMSLRPLEQRAYDGGAAIIARHLAAMGARPTLVTGLPRTPAAASLRERLAADGVEVRAIETDGPLLEKQRFLVGTQKVMKLDLVQPITLDAGRQEALVELAVDSSRGKQAAIIADFGNGLLTSGLLPRLCAGVRARVDFMAGDVSGRRSSLLHMQGMDLVTPTEAELRDAMRDYDDSLNTVVWRMLEQTGSRQAMVTMGSDGLIAFERLPHEPGDEGWSQRVRGEHVPALAPHALDVLGCGDALLAAATLAMTVSPALEDSLALAGYLASIAASEEAGRLGNEPITARDLRLALRRLGDSRLVTSPASSSSSSGSGVVRIAV